MKANKFWISFLACFVVIVLLGVIAIFAIPSLQTNMADSIVEKSQKYKDICDENDTLKTELTIKNLEYSNTVSKLNTAQTSLTNEIALNAQLNTQLASAINEKTILQSSLNDKDADIQTLNAQITAKNSEIANIQTLLDNSNTRIDDLENYIADLENQVTSLNLEIARFDEIRRTVNDMTIEYKPEYSYIELCFYDSPAHRCTYGGPMDCYYDRNTNQFSTVFSGDYILNALDLLDYDFGFEVMQHDHYTVYMESGSTAFMVAEFRDISDDCSFELNRIYLDGEITTVDVIRDNAVFLTYSFTLETTYNIDGEISDIKINIFATSDGSRPFYID